MDLQQHKRPYESPEIVDLGAMEELTRGPVTNWGEHAAPMEFSVVCRPNDSCWRS